MAGKPMDGFGAGFPCPKCGGFARVVDSRKVQAGTNVAINRRRACANGHRFNTQERCEEAPAKIAGADLAIIRVRDIADRVRALLGGLESSNKQE